MGRASFLCVTLILSGCQLAMPRYLGPCPRGHDLESLAGIRAAPALEQSYGGAIRDAAFEARMARVLRRLTDATPVIAGRYHFRLLKADRLNACSLPGNRVYVTRGLYGRIRSDDQLAAVIAHEIAHLRAKDHFKPRCDDKDAALAREIAADGEAVRYLKRAEFNPQAMMQIVEIIRDVQPPGWAEVRSAALRGAKS
jgi:predicted Zn-dependent protease